MLVSVAAPSSSAYAVAQQADGKLVVCGKNTVLSPFANDSMLLRINTDGSLDASFDGDGKKIISTSAGDESITTLAVQSDGKILAAGYSFAPIDTTLVRVNADGSPDSSFGTDGILNIPMAIEEDRARSLLIDTNGKIFVAGFRAHTTSREYEFAVLKLDQNGSRDASFSSDGLVSFWIGADTFVSEQINALATQTNGKIVVAGTAGNTFVLARYNADGSLDLTFDGDGRLVLAPLDNANNQSSAAANSVAIQRDGKIVAAGSVFDTAISTRVIVVARFLPDGTPDASFDGDGKLTTRLNTWLTSARAVVIQPDGKIVAAGTSATSAFGMPQFAAVRYNPDGSLDTSFDGDGKFVSGGGQYAYSVALQADGKIVLGGGGNGVFAAARLTPGGTLDSEFGTGGFARTSFGYSCEGRSMALQGDGKVIVAGFSQPSIFVENDFTLVRFNSNGLLDPTFDNDGIITATIGAGRDEAYTVSLQGDGKIIAAGKSVGSETHDDFALARFYSGYTPISRKSYFDFDGDAKTDISIFRPSDGSWWYSQSSDNQFRVFNFGTSSDKLTPSDYTGDGRSDIALFRPSTGEWFIQRSEDGSFYSVPFGAAGDVPVSGDFDADGRGDIAVFRLSTSTWFINRSSGGTLITTFGTGGDQPVAADYDGDGRTDIAIFRPSDGSWWYLRSSDNQFRVFSFGVSTDKPVPGDYTGDGKADIAVFRPSTGEWFVQRSEDNSYFSFPFGAAGDLPVPGDYDGDGKMDSGVFRPSSSTWFINRTTAGILITNFGTSGDRPVPNVFIP